MSEFYSNLNYYHLIPDHCQSCLLTVPFRCRHQFRRHSELLGEAVVFSQRLDPWKLYTVGHLYVVFPCARSFAASSRAVPQDIFHLSLIGWGVLYAPPRALCWAAKSTQTLFLSWLLIPLLHLAFKTLNLPPPIPGSDL